MFARNDLPGTKLLDGIELFDDCTRRELRAIASVLCPIEVQPGSVMTREGAPADQFLVIVAGTARATTVAGASELMGRGAFVGEQALERKGRAEATVVAATRMTLLVATPAELRGLVELAPSVRRTLQRGVPCERDVASGRERRTRTSARRRERMTRI